MDHQPTDPAFGVCDGREVARLADELWIISSRLRSLTAEATGLPVEIPVGPIQLDALRLPVAGQSETD